MYVAVDFRRFYVNRTANYCNTVLQWRYFLCRFGDGFSPFEFLLSPDKYGDFGDSAGGGCSTAKYPLQTASAIFLFLLFPHSATTHCNIPTTPFKGGRYVAVGCCTHFVSIFSAQIFGKKMKKLSPNDKKYIAEYRRWFDKLPERQRAIMKKQGLDKPHIDDYTTRQAFDISDIQIADTSRDEEPDGAKVFSERDFRCRFAEFADIVFEEILRRKNVALTVECMRFIFGKSRYRSESEIANSLKMTRANVSARCVELRDKFGMEASLFGHGMRSRQSYRNSVVDSISDSEKRFERISKGVR